jgi:hypothetical protein
MFVRYPNKDKPFESTKGKRERKTHPRFKRKRHTQKKQDKFFQKISFNFIFSQISKIKKMLFVDCATEMVRSDEKIRKKSNQ